MALAIHNPCDNKEESTDMENEQNRGGIISYQAVPVDWQHKKLLILSHGFDSANAESENQGWR